MLIINPELLIRVVISALAAYRVARMIATERGPFDLFIDFRSWVINKPGQKKWVIVGITCPLCVGFWASLTLFGLSYLDYVVYAVAGLAVAGLQAAVQRQERVELPEVFLVKFLPKDKPKQ